MRNLLENLLTGKGLRRAGKGKGTYRAGEGIVRDSLTNFEIIKYYENESRFNSVYSRDNLPTKIRDEAYVINLDEYSDIGTDWIALYVKNNDITYCDSFGVEHIPKEIKAFIKNKNINTNIFRI